LFLFLFSDVLLPKLYRNGVNFESMDDIKKLGIPDWVLPAGEISSMQAAHMMRVSLKCGLPAIPGITFYADCSVDSSGNCLFDSLWIHAHSYKLCEEWGSDPDDPNCGNQ